MSDEEIVSLNRMKLFARSSDLSVVTAKDMDIVVTLVEKQSKEIEELQAINQMQKYRIEVMDERELISRDEVEEIIKTEIKKCENEKENANRIHYNYWNRFEQQLQSVLDKIKGDD